MQRRSCLICGNKVINAIIFCRGSSTYEKRNGVGKTKASFTSPVTSNKRIVQWGISLLESLSMLFGLPVNDPSVYETFSEIFKESEKSGNERRHQEKTEKRDKGQLRLKMCDRCLEDVSKAHYVFWQLYNLEKKLVRLQHLVYQRLRRKYEKDEVVTVNPLLKDRASASTTVKAEEKETQSLFEKINLHKDYWPQISTYVTRWKLSQDFAESLVAEQSILTLHTSDDAASFSPPNISIKRTLNDADLLPEETEQCEQGQSITDSESDSDNNLLYDDNVDDSDWCINSELDDDAAPRSPKEKKTLTNKQIKSKIKMTSTVTMSKDSKVFQCTVDPDICNRKFTQIKRLNRHIVDFHKGRTYICDVEGCIQKFLSEFSLRCHKKKAHGVGAPVKIKCDYDDCPETFSRKRALETHKVQIHGEKAEKIMTVCEICGARVANQKLKAHVRAYHRGFKKFSCKCCPMDYTTSEALESHENLHDQVSLTTPFLCVLPNCQQVFPSSVDLGKHVISNHLTDWLECDVCGVKKPNDVLLKVHVMQCHTKKETGTYMCDQCPKVLPSAAKLCDHKRDHHLATKYSCETCGNQFSHKRNLLRHLRTHLVDKPFKCALCPKTFAYKQALKNHEAIHSGTKSFECHLCKKRFTSVNNLRQHLSTQQHGGAPLKPKKRKKLQVKRATLEEEEMVTVY